MQCCSKRNHKSSFTRLRNARTHAGLKIPTKKKHTHNHHMKIRTTGLKLGVDWRACNTLYQQQKTGRAPDTFQKYATHVRCCRVWVSSSCEHKSCYGDWVNQKKKKTCPVFLLFSACARFAPYYAVCSLGSVDLTNRIWPLFSLSVSFTPFFFGAVCLCVCVDNCSTTVFTTLQQVANACRLNDRATPSIRSISYRSYF